MKSGNSALYHRNETWRWWQRLMPHGNRWSGLHRATVHANTHYPWWQRFVHWFIPHPRNGYRPHAVHHHALAAYSIILVIAKLSISVGLFLTFPTEAHFSSLTAQRVIELANKVRTEAGIAPLIENDLLQDSARMKAEEMARLGYFAHTSPEGESPWRWFKRAGYEYTYAGENLAMDFRDADEVVHAWMESPKHRENIMNPKYKEIGIAVTTGAVNGRMVTLIVQHFGASLTSPSVTSFGARDAVYGTETGAPEVAAASTESRMMPVTSVWWKDVLSVFSWTAVIFAVWLALQLFLTIFAHMHIQHRGAVYTAVLVLGLTVGILYTHVHFLERLGNVPIVF